MSEFALRIALCDLCERFKRCEHKCKYLEQCRNELLKEIIRLRLENESLIASMPMRDHCNDPMLYAPQFSTGHSNYIGTESIKSAVNALNVRQISQLTGSTERDTIESNRCDYNDESLDEITERLIRELRRDVQDYAKNERLSHSQVTQEDNEKTPLTEPNPNPIQEKVYRSSPIDFIMDKNCNRYETQVKKIAIPNDSNDYSVDSNMSLLLNNVRKDENEIIESNQSETNEMSSDTSNNNPSQIETGNFENLQNPLSLALFNVRKDLEFVSCSISNQNEKLIRLKAKQLRNYFKRQINDDHGVN